MKLNPDCLRDTLIWLEENIKVNDECFSSYHLQDLYDALPKHENEDIYYSIYNLFQIRYIEGKFSLLPSGAVKICEIRNITWNGHQFLNTIRPTSIWKATKAGASKLGIMSVHALSTIAMKVAEAVVTNPVVINKIVEHM